MERGKKSAMLDWGGKMSSPFQTSQITCQKTGSGSKKSNFFIILFYLAQKRKIVGPDRVSRRASPAFLNRFRVLSRGTMGGTKGGGEGVTLREGSCHVEKESRVLKKMKYLM